MMIYSLRIPQSFVRVCALFVGLIVFSIILTDKGKHSAMVNENLLDFFPEANSDGSRLIWSHAVNSRTHLEDALKSKTMMLEADVSMSTSLGQIIPIMAHPPSTESDITLEEWLAEVVKHKKGIKLDFKTVEVLEPAIKILKKYQSQIKVPLIMNADVLPGPGNPLAVPLDSRKFVETCKAAFPDGILSLGWTTYVDSSVINPTYDADMIAEMKKLIAESKTTQPVTFPVRACVAKNSLHQLQSLLRFVPGSTLTVWSSPGDPVTSRELLKFRSHFNLKSLYFDLPSPLKEEFLEGLTIA